MKDILGKSWGAAHVIAVIILVGTYSVSAQNDRKVEPNMTKGLPETEAAFTDDELKDYYLVYENKAVRHIRTVIDRYLQKANQNDDETEKLKGIDSAYLKSRFNVLSRDPDVFGNTHVMLISVDRPDKVFVATVYTGNGFRLDRFSVDERFNEEDLRRMRIRYRKFLEDKKHSL